MASQQHVLVLGGGVVGVSVLHALAHAGVPALLLEQQHDLALAASATNSGALHTGFDSPAGELETRLILRSAELRKSVLGPLGIPVWRCGALVEPSDAGEAATVRGLEENAARNGVEVRELDRGALEVPGESITDPVAYVLTLAASAVAAGARIERDAEVVDIDRSSDSLIVRTRGGGRFEASAVINCAGLYADRIARLVGDDGFEIYPRKGEFLVFRLHKGDALSRILLPVPTPATKGVLVFPTLDGHVVAGPTAADQLDKEDWAVRPEAEGEILGRAEERFPALSRATLVGRYAGLRPAGRNSNYIIGPAATESRFINVAAIRSTGLSASLGIAEHVLGMLPALDVAIGESAPPTPARPRLSTSPWWDRVARVRAAAAN